MKTIKSVSVELSQNWTPQRLVLILFYEPIVSCSMKNMLTLLNSLFFLFWVVYCYNSSRKNSWKNKSTPRTIAKRVGEQKELKRSEDNKDYNAGRGSDKTEAEVNSKEKWCWTFEKDGHYLSWTESMIRKSVAWVSLIF